MMDLLPPCPFCRHPKPKLGGQRKGRYSRGSTSYYVRCPKCWARGPRATHRGSKEMSSGDHEILQLKAVDLWSKWTMKGPEK